MNAAGWCCATCGRGGGVHLVVEHDQRTAVPGRLRGCDVQRSGQVRGTVGAGQRRVAHRAGQDEWRVVRPDRVDEEGRLLQRVRALGEHDAAGTVGDRLAGGIDRVEHVVEGQVGARPGAEVVHLDVETARQRAEAGHQVVTGEPGDDPAVVVAGHRDRAAEREQHDRPGPHGR